MTYTPGPWATRKTDKNYPIHSVAIYDGSPMPGKVAVVYGSVSPIHDTHVGAYYMDGNANLIASAPDLLEAVEAGLMYIECCTAPDGKDNASNALRLARAAIAKAKGQTNA